MSLIKKINVEEHLAARRAMRLGRGWPLSQAGVRIEPATAANTASDRLIEGAIVHSSATASFTSTPITAGFDGAHVSTLPRNRQA